LGKDLLPRLASAIESAYVGDCIGFENSPDGIVWARPLCAGNAIAYCQSETTKAIIAVRHSEFSPATPNGGESPIVPVPAAPAETPAGRKTLTGFEAIENPRPELTEARVVVSGGRALAGRFFEVLGPLADTLGAALGATRAACDDGYAPGDFQVGQTGKVVAPDLYFAVGISGAIQHVAGMKGARVVVAINSDPQAPIVSVADYTLVGDLFRLVPELVDELRKHAQNS
jgi:electron transfer flavoprotein alpha subunit